MKPGFRIEPDGWVMDARQFLVFPIGRVSRIGESEYWVALDGSGYALAGPTRHRDLAALTVVRQRCPEATLRSLAS
jgi:hypothetical protein